MDTNDIPIRAFVTSATTADYSKAEQLIAQIKDKHLLADYGYDSQKILDSATKLNINPVIQPRKNRKNQRYYDKNLYNIHHLIENAFLYFKRWRGIATRYANNITSFDQISSRFVPIHPELFLSELYLSIQDFFECN